MVIQPVFLLFITGFSCFYYFASDVGLSRMLVPAVLLCLVVKVVVDLCQAKIRYAAVLSAGILLGLYSGSVAYALFAQPRMLVPLHSVSEITCRLISDPVPYGDSYFAADAEITAATGFHRITSQSKGRITAVIPRNIALSGMPGSFAAASPFILPAATGAELRCRGSFAEKKQEGDYCRFFVRTAELQGYDSRYAEKRAVLRSKFARLLYGWGNAGGLLFAFFSGSKQYIPRQFLISMRNAGCSHVLALSGMHVSLFFSLVCMFFCCTGFRRLSRLAGTAAVVMFLLFAGFTPSLIRSVLMISLLVLCRSFHIRSGMLPILLCVLPVHLLIFPEQGREVSFLLSYSSLAALLTLSPVLFTLFLRFFPSIVPQKFSAGIAASLSALLGTAAFSVYYFECLYPVGILASLVTAFLAAVFMIAGLLAVIAVLIVPSLYSTAKICMIALYRVFSICADFFAAFPPVHLSAGSAASVFCICFMISCCILYAGKKFTGKRSVLYHEYAGL